MEHWRSGCDSRLIEQSSEVAQARALNSFAFRVSFDFTCRLARLLVPCDVPRARNLASIPFLKRNSPT